MSNETEQEGTHFLVSKDVLQNVYNYLGSKPAAEVFDLMSALRTDARSMIVQEKANENSTEEAGPASSNTEVC